MKKLLKPANLPAVTAALGGMALVLRRLLYTFGVDVKGLLVAGHPLALMLLALTAGTLVYIVSVVRRLDGSEVYEDNFNADIPALLGHVAGAAGIAVTVLTHDPLMHSYLGMGWKLLGYLAPLGLVAAGVCRSWGRKPFFVLHLLPCLFYVFHVVNHYQKWSGEPQFQNYGYALFGTMALMFFAFYTACFAADAGNRRMHLFTGAAAVFLLMAELAWTAYPWLYLGGILWAMTNLCTLSPKPKREENPQEEK